MYIISSIKALTIFATGLCLIFISSGFKKQDDQPNQFRFHTVIIDAGHGGKDPGAHGAYSKEKNVALSIAKKLQAALNEQMPEIKTVMTRTTDDFIPLNERARIANSNKGNLFISIHCNSSPAVRGSGRGAMLLVYGFHRSEEQREALRENAAISYEKDYKTKYGDYDPNSPAAAIILNNYMLKYRKQSILFGSLLNDQFVNSDNRHSIGVKEQGVLVLAHSAMPAVLIETGFINNPDDEEYLNSDEGQQQIVRSVVRALKSYKEKITAN
ncbi:N-acetylmuramoyl-L-alanine amidase family protein [Mucilaginibacter ginkgonis]|uniref:N-acetylmuramoyl-L-alanine amidase n=1 Tax=Mucilaginibacter ginkgonis TaxID=2682091 RepID=A0A6I4HU71_9SPHI|nr:N-acetylmuramoyl-L-alanine amidase [Mucilaginibacter ginkgonis]QQL50369.1 N-acetylmuramoyl-L-alanine amidase [Mucilaginibacter ginkgonis]